jgi:hypothetical protein
VRISTLGFGGQFKSTKEKANMALLDNLLGDISSSTDIGAVVGANPALDVGVHDVNVAGLVGIGDVGLGLSVPVAVGVSASNDLSITGGDSGGGLLGGLL